MTHTPTPYNAEYAEDSDALLISGTPNAKGWGVEICTVADEGTAAFIVRACNSHAKLVEALEEAVQMLLAAKVHPQLIPKQISILQQLEENN